MSFLCTGCIRSPHNIVQLKLPTGAYQICVRFNYKEDVIWRVLGRHKFCRLSSFTVSKVVTGPSNRFYCRPTLVKGDIAVDFSGRPAICPVLITVFLFANISVIIHRIAFIFYAQLPKDIGNTFPGYFCKKKIYCKFRRFRLVF